MSHSATVCDLRPGAKQDVCVVIKRKRRPCMEPGCDKSARDNTDKCSAHGGGKRCMEPGCDKSARDNTDKCKAHGGGKRCM